MFLCDTFGSLSIFLQTVFSFDAETLTLIFVSTFDLQQIAKYNITGRILVFPVTGHGDSQIDLSKSICKR